MMKRFFAAFVALMLVLLPVMSMAETADLLDYEDPDGRYAFMYPSNWILVSDENIETILDAAAESDNEQLDQMVEAYGPQIKESGMVMLISETGMTNVNVVVISVGVQATDEILLTLAPMLVEQLSGIGESMQFLDEGTIIDLGDKHGLMMEYVYELTGIPMHGVQVYVPGATDLYVFTYTCVDGNELETTAGEFGYMLGTLTVK